MGKSARKMKKQVSGWLMGGFLLGGFMMGLLSGCAKDRGMGQIVSQDRKGLESLCGKADQEKQARLAKGSQVLVYSEDGADPCRASKVSCQFKGNKSQGCHREPQPHERTLQYWRHQWKGLEQKFEPIADGGLHGPREFQLTAPSLGVAVVYDQSTDRIVRIMEYATH